MRHAHHFPPDSAGGGRHRESLTAETAPIGPDALARAVVSRRAQGLPDRVTDPAVLARIAGLLTAGRRPLPRPQVRERPD